LARAVTVLRHVIAITVLPVTVVCIVPLWIAERYGVPMAGPANIGESGLALGGCVLLAIGGVLFVKSVRRFAGEGHGTLAPWDPPRRFVAAGPYRYVRHPMITGVIFLLAGEAAIDQHKRLAWHA
jgi:protein-S-isoprenylcysteine O-methyltransferase Ste14